ncbi:hypothetical protein J4727_19365, partial [Providencia rettgeri]|nr:hypothetical protein [Providencia rettgeri]
TWITLNFHPQLTLGMIATGLLQGLVCCKVAGFPEKIWLDCLWRACDRRVFIRFTLLRDLF